MLWVRRYVNLIGFGLALLIILILAWIIFSLYSDLFNNNKLQLTGCAWQTECWHDDYIDLFVNDGLVANNKNHGDLLGFLSYNLESITTSHLLTLISLIFGSITFILGINLGGRHLKRQNTVHVLTQIFSTEALSAANAKLAQINLDVQRGNYTLDGNVPEEIDKHIIVMLDFYEFISHGAIYGTLSAKTIKYQRGGTMRTTFQACEKYITERRELLERPNLYHSYEVFIKKYVKNHDI